MTEDLTRSIIAILVIVLFTAFMVATLMGFVRIESAEMAKLVGATFGYLTGLITMVFARYFGKIGTI
jgi:hypothetical protein